MKNHDYPTLAKKSHYAQLWALKVEPITMFESKKGSQKVQKAEAHDVYLQNILLRASFAPMCCSQFLLLRIPSQILNFQKKLDCLHPYILEASETTPRRLLKVNPKFETIES
jgi:hypothetical protein